MNSVTSIRLHDQPAALERVVGLLRRRGFVVTRLSTSTATGRAIEVVVRIDGSISDQRRLHRELLTLQDVIDVRSEGAAPTNTRELLLIRLKQGESAGCQFKSIGQGICESVGSPGEIDATLRALQKRNAITGYVRSGEVVAPETPETSILEE